MVLQMRQRMRVGGPWKILLCNKHRLDLRYTGRHNETLKKTNAYPVLGIEKMRVEVGLLMIGEPVLQTGNVFQQQFQHGRRIALPVPMRRQFPTVKNRIRYIGSSTIQVAYRQKGHDIQKAEKQEVRCLFPMLS